MAKVGNYKLDDIIAFTKTIPNVTVHNNGNQDVAEYKPAYNINLKPLHMSKGMQLSQLTSWMKQVYMYEKRLPELPTRELMEKILKEGKWN